MDDFLKKAMPKHFYPLLLEFVVRLDQAKHGSFSLNVSPFRIDFVREKRICPTCGVER